MSTPPRAPLHSRHRCALLAASLLAAIACRSQVPSPARDAGPAAAELADASTPAGADPDGGPAAATGADAGAPDAGATALPVSSALAIAGGEERPLDREGTTLVDPAATFRVELAAQITDGRLALHDAQDAMVASNGTTEVGASWTKFHLTPQEPLRPGSAYVLQLDGAVQREAHDPSGRAYVPVVLLLRTTGEPPAPAKKPKRASSRP